MTTELIEELRNTFAYHTDGYLIRKKNCKPCGQYANHSGGYVIVKLNGKKLLAHRIIYALVNGRMPDGDIDHLNGNRSDNRIENLQVVSRSENQHDRKKRKDNTSGFTGKCRNAQARKIRYPLTDAEALKLAGSIYERILQHE